MNEETLDKAEANAKMRFEALKIEGGKIEARIAEDNKNLAKVAEQMIRIQGEFQAIQNLRPQADAKLTDNKK